MQLIYFWNDLLHCELFQNSAHFSNIGYYNDKNSEVKWWWITKLPYLRIRRSSCAHRLHSRTVDLSACHMDWARSKSLQVVLHRLDSTRSRRESAALRARTLVAPSGIDTVMDIPAPMPGRLESPKNTHTFIISRKRNIFTSISLTCF